MLVFARPVRAACASSVHRLPVPPPPRRLRCAAFSTSHAATASRRPQNFDSGFTSSYDPTQDAGRGPIFAKSTFGVPQFYPRDLKRRVDEYVVGQDRAKKTICSVIFNHYQGLRRRQHHEAQDQRLREKLQRQKYAQDRDLYERSSFGANTGAPGEGGRRLSGRSSRSPSYRYWADRQFSPQDAFSEQSDAGQGTRALPEESFDIPADDFYIQEDSSMPKHVKIDKSNILLIGPTGVGKTYILESVTPLTLNWLYTDFSPQNT